MQLENERVRAEAEHESQLRQQARLAEERALLERAPEARRAELCEATKSEERPPLFVQPASFVTHVGAVREERPPRAKKFVVALVGLVAAWTGSIVITTVRWERAADEEKRTSTLNQMAAEESWARTRRDLERQISESDRRLREKMAELEETKKLLANVPNPSAGAQSAANAPKPAPRPPAGVPAHRPASCDPHDPLCADLP
jgi:hypothetical protein